MLQTTGNYEDAIKLLSEIPGYKDSDALLLEYKSKKEADEKRLAEEERLRIENENRIKREEEQRRKEEEERKRKEAEEKEEHDRLLFEKAVVAYEKADTIEDYEKCRALFQKLKGYKDSELYAGRARNKIKKIKTEAIIKQAEGQADSAVTVSDFERILRTLSEKQQYGYNLKQIITELENRRDYLKYEDTYNRLIVKLEEAQDPAAAEQLIREFGVLRNYKDSQKYAKMAEEKRANLLCEKKYKEAVVIVEKEAQDSSDAEMQRAITWLSDIKNYKDSARLIEIAKSKKIECIYLDGKKALAKADKASTLEYAKNCFARISNYKDSARLIEIAKSKITERIYLDGKEALAKADNVNALEYAKNCFARIPDYKDSVRITEQLEKAIVKYNDLSGQADICIKKIGYYQDDMKKLGLFDRKKKKELEASISQLKMELDALEREKENLVKSTQ